jgi:dolichol-phosphate mannosyltransferase
MFVSFIYVVYSLYARIFQHRPPQGFTGLIVAITFLSGMILFFLGVIGEYVGRIYEETKGRPQYIVGRRTGRGACPNGPAERALEKDRPR